MDTFGDALAFALDGRTQRWLAEQLGLTPQRINGWTRRGVEPGHYRGQIVAVLGVDPASDLGHALTSLPSVKP
jgi:hypothetical protein